MSMKILSMQSGISVISESYEPKPRRSIDPSAFNNQPYLPPKPSIITNTEVMGVPPFPRKPYSKTPASNSLRSRSNSRQNVDEEGGGKGSPFMNSTLATKRLNFEFNLDGHIKKTRQAGRYLKQIIHSKDCVNLQCPHLTCARTKQILLHVQTCSVTFCDIPGCQTTKRLLEHSRTCQNSWYKIHATTTAQQDFCLLCTIAHCEENNRLLHRQPSYCYEDTDVYALNDKDAKLLPMISDEFIEFSRIPFQSFPQISPPAATTSTTMMREDHEDFEYSPRAKTYSDSNFATSSNESNKKQRSKSWAVPSSPSFDPSTSVYTRTAGISPFAKNSDVPSTPLHLLFPSNIALPTTAATTTERQEEDAMQYADQQVERMDSLISVNHEIKRKAIEEMEI